MRNPILPQRLHQLSLALILMLATVAAAWLGVDRWIATAPLPTLRQATSVQVQDRDGRLLRAFQVGDGRWRLRVNPDQVDPVLIRLLIDYEDRSFLQHRGVDWLALVRAAGQLAGNARIVSGGSTLTMQLARLLDGRPTRSPLAKLRQIRTALALERRYDKQQILAAYLQLAPYGGNLEGVASASHAWLGKGPERLGIGEAALLVALPQSPAARRPDRYPEAARRARDRVLARATASGTITPGEAARGRAEPLPRTRRDFPMLAAHLAEARRRAEPTLGSHRTTLSAPLQAALEQQARQHALTLGAGISAAILLADHRSGEILATVGSAGLLDEARAGHMDMTVAPRSPGSTLKPLIYGLAFEAGIAHPESLIDDRPTAFGGYVPGNFDAEFAGTVSLRQALTRSLNVPAIKLLDLVGPARLLSRLRTGGARPRIPGQAAAGLAIGLGGLGLTLRELVGIYAGIANGGKAIALHDRPRLYPEKAKRLLDERAAWLVTDVLRETPGPSGRPVRGLAFKTGTSYGYRDAWAIGFDGRHVIGVWVGRADATAVPGLTGISAAAPLLVDVFGKLAPVDLPPPPPGVLMAGNAELPPAMRHLDAHPGDQPAASAPPEIAFPPHGAELELNSTPTLVLKVRDGTPPFSWFVDGTPLPPEPFAREARWEPRGRGFSVISVVDGSGRSERVRVRLD